MRVMTFDFPQNGLREDFVPAPAKTPATDTILRQSRKTPNDKRRSYGYNEAVPDATVSENQLWPTLDQALAE